MCNQSLMKLVTPEDDEPDEPKPVVQKQAEAKPEDSSAKQEGTASGKWAASHPSPPREGDRDPEVVELDSGPHAATKATFHLLAPNSGNSPVRWLLSSFSRRAPGSGIRAATQWQRWDLNRGSQPPELFVPPRALMLSFLFWGSAAVGVGQDRPQGSLAP